MPFRLFTASAIFVWLTLFSIAMPAQALEASNGVQVKQVLKTSQSWNDAPLAYPAGTAEITGLMIEIAPGAETGWHLHPAPSFGVILQGDLQVSLKNGETHVFHAGEAIAEVVNTLHNGRNIGTVPLKLMVFYAGSKEQPNTIKATDH